MRLRIENRGTKNVYWNSDSCQVPGLAYVHLIADAWIGGESQSGIAAEFKAFALEPFGHAGYSPLFVGLRSPEIPDGAGCADVGFIHKLEPGMTLERVAIWTGTAHVAIPEGPVDIVGAFEYWSDSGLEVGRTEVEARLPSWIVSDQVVDYIPPGPAIDVVLADDTFATWLAGKPSTEWINSTHTLDLDDGTWEIGLFRNFGPEWFASVTFDARTGVVLDHRLE